jgi:hypothetical protein
MSAISLKGNASGTGTLTIAAPNTNTNQTLTLPDQTGTFMVNGPAFSAYPSAAQTLTTATFTKAQINTEVFDTASAFDNVTNYRFLPLIAGYYQVNAAWYSSITSGQVSSNIYKNGAGYQSTAANGSSTGVVLNVSTILYLNGSTDYIEFYLYQNSGISFTTLASRADLNYFNACLIRSA